MGGLGAVVLPNTGLFAIDLGWRLAFGIGAVLGVGVLVVRRNVPESPRWLFIHGQEREAERIVGGIEDSIRQETGEELPEAGESSTVRQRKAIPFREIAKVAIELYPKWPSSGFACSWVVRIDQPVPVHGRVDAVLLRGLGRRRRGVPHRQ